MSVRDRGAPYTCAEPASRSFASAGRRDLAPFPVMSSLPPPSFPPPGGAPEPAPPPADTPPTGESPSGTDRGSRTALIAVAVACVALVVAGYVFIVRGGGDGNASSGGAIEFEQRWDERARGLGDAVDADTPVSLIAADDETLVFSFLTETGFRLVTLDSATGEQLWQEDYDVFGGPPPQVVLTGGRVLVTDFVDTDGGTRSTLYALDARSGDELWTVESVSLPTSWSVVGDRVVVRRDVDDVRSLMGVDLASGDELWTFEDDHLLGTASVIRADLVVATIGRDDSDGGTATALDPATGEERWSVELDELGPQFDWLPNETTESVLLFDGDDIVAVDSGSGDEQWRVGAPEADEPFDRTLTTYVDEGVAIACGELDGSVGIAVIALDSGEVRWDDSLGEQGAFFGLAGGHVIVSDGEGSQIPGCFPYGGPQTSVPTARSLDSGDEVWSLDDDGFVMSLTDRVQPSRGILGWVVDSERRQRLIGPVTGESVAEVEWAEGDRPSNLYVLGDSAVAMQIGDEIDSGWYLYDPNDLERRVEFDGTPRPAGAWGGVAYVVVGDHVVAID